MNVNSNSITMEFLKIIFSFSIMWIFFYLRSFDIILGINLFLMCIFKTDEIENLCVQPRTKMGRILPFSLDTSLWKFDKGFSPSHSLFFHFHFSNLSLITLSRVENHFYLILFSTNLFLQTHLILCTKNYSTLMNFPFANSWVIFLLSDESKIRK